VPGEGIEQEPIQGLDAAAAAARLRAEGYNELPRGERRTIIHIFLEVIRQPMFALLLGGGAIYLLLGEVTEALVLLGFATLSVSITIIQEYRSERVLEALRELTSPRALVVRDGERIRIPGREVVREDIIILVEGDRVPADALLLSNHDLLLDESLLTGESLPVRKAVAATVPGVPIPGGDDQPYAFAGSIVVRGSGMARVTAIGSASEIGKIGRSLGAIVLEPPHLQRQIRWIVRDFAIVGVSCGTLVVLLFGLLRGSWLAAALAGIAFGMAVLPEEFPLVLTVFMAMGAWRISQARVLTRRAATIETLGAATVLCTDKTGTLTENRMEVVALATEEEDWGIDDHVPLSGALTSLAEAGYLASPPASADPMDKAARAFAVHAGARPHNDRTLLKTYGLSPDLFAITNVWGAAGSGEATAYVKGAPETIARLCRRDSASMADIQKSAGAFADRGMRVLAVATASAMASNLPDSQLGFEFEFLGLMGFADPLRPNVPAAVSECHSAGVRVIMITGDYPSTALAIAAQAGISLEGGVLSGGEIDTLDDATLAARVRSVSVFARIRPAQKLRIVEALKAQGQVVAMTGDGVNDAPAMKAAHIGIAMGGRGTDVAREASSLVLLNDDFDSIVSTIRLGRRIYDNLRKAMAYIVAVHMPIVGLALLPLFLGLPLILLPVHIAFLEMVIDPACSVVFEAEREEDDVMRRRPRDPQSALLPRRLIVWALIQGLLAFALVGGVLVIGAQLSMPEGDLRALVFMTLVLTNVGLILVNRSFSASLLRAFSRPNRSLWYLLTGVAVVLGLALYTPAGARFFRFGAVHWHDLAVSAVVGAGMLILLEIVKLILYRRAVLKLG